MDTLKRRNTRQRALILRAVQRVRSHPDARSIYRRVKRDIPAIGVGTVYRNLDILQEEGKIIELSLGTLGARYDGCTDNHYHFICLRCHRVYDLKSPSLAGLEKKVAGETGFECRYHRVNVYGHCRDCRGIKKRGGNKHG